MLFWLSEHLLSSGRPIYITMIKCQQRTLMSGFSGLYLLFSFFALSQTDLAKKLPDSILVRNFSNPILTYPTKIKNTSNTIFKPSKSFANGKFSYKEPGCYSTATRIRFTEDSLHIGNSRIIKSSDGNLLIAGYRIKSYTPHKQVGYLIKCTPNGDTLWIKNLESPVSSATMYSTNIFELNDRSLILVSRIYVDLPINYRDDLVLTKLSEQGDFIWQKSFISPLWPNATGDFEINDLKQNETGDIFICGGIVASLFSEYGLVARLSDQGEIIWSKGLQSNDEIPVFVGFNLKGALIEAYGRISTEQLGMAVLDAQTGDLLTSKAYGISAPYPTSVYKFFNPYGQVLLDNGNTVLYGRANSDLLGPGMVGHWATLELDPSFEPVSSYSYQNDLASNFYDTRIIVNKDGSTRFSLSTFDQSTNTVNIFVAKSKKGQLLKERMIPFPGDYPHDFSNFIALNEGTDVIVSHINNGNDYTLTSINLLTINNTDTASECTGFDTSLTKVDLLEWFSHPLTLTPFDNAIASVYHEIYYPIDDGFHIVNGCQQVSYCDTFALRLVQDTICLSNQTLIQLTKNPQCGAPVEWDYRSAPVQTFQYANDSSVLVGFSAPWEGYIYGEVKGCETYRDSVKLTVLGIPPPLELGPDRNLCSSNSITINAKRGYISYLWNNGSTDSLLVISQPGIYYVDVSDACGGMYSDTIHVVPKQTNFDLGVDKVKCNKDTVEIIAPPGFINYRWGPNYNITSISPSVVQVFPDVDTIYYVSAQKDVDCFVWDTVSVKVNHSQAINLGVDQSLCEGDSLLLDAGPSFFSYNWSNGTNLQSIFVQQPGDYLVAAMNINGCTSADTFTLISLWKNPLPVLEQSNWLCEGQGRVLNPGIFVSYLWQNGSSQPNFTVDGLGTYTVLVKDDHQCVGSDTIVIDTYRTAPNDFLPADTMICPGARISIKSSSEFTRYLWNDGSFQASNIISVPGLYSLEIEDQYECIGKDSILINQMANCAIKVWVPTAFSPNNDGLNDILLPIIAGEIFDYGFRIFNRWGEIVFSTRDRYQGWDGSYKGAQQDGNTFIWVLTYRDRQSSVLTEQKGTLTLIR